MGRTNSRTLGGSRRVLGDRAEQLAFDYLRGQGLKPLDRNVHCRLGEIDLVMRDGNCVVIIEVRYRTARSLTPAHLTVDWKKQQKLIRTAAIYLQRRRRWQNAPLRFDVVGVDVSPDNDTEIAWIRDAFRPSDSAL